MRATSACLARGLLLIACALAASTSAAESRDNAALRGVKRIAVVVDGINAGFERYGLTAERLRSNTESLLRERGFELLDAAAAENDPQAARLTIRLYANQSSYAFYSCRVAVRLERKLRFADAGDGFVLQPVWSDGRNCVLNPSDLQRVYGYAETIVNRLLEDHGRYNAAS